MTASAARASFHLPQICFETCEKLPKGVQHGRLCFAHPVCIVVEERDPHIDLGFGKYQRLSWAFGVTKRRIGQRREDNSSLQVEGIGAQDNCMSS